MATDPRQQEQARKYGQLVAKAWSDEAFKQRLLADPKAVLVEQGIAVPDGVEVPVVENTAQLFYLTLPPKPGEGELSEERLGQVAAGSACCDEAYFKRCWCGFSSGDVP